ncbi:hypothetical protein SEA_BAILEYBLU_27 [Arthrobacter phage BaileyBlu]|uniref:Uncharacterized protein n=1 Tax=Arthrobacter phage BaileyBlu TaxID=2910754 RepID=A0AA49GZB8_9CAUD|nr:hypothetical protein PQD78_gp27 [Arthrobacter phage BaileyBlu]UJQ87165.1 hypothetical protein SEA_BAILEYBLU_27 [Arthrobacter phage BaileyBlu]
MSRVYTDGGNVYRVRVVTRYRDGRETTMFLGPYATIGAARGQATSWRSPHRTATVEFIPGDTWQEVEE